MKILKIRFFHVTKGPNMSGGLHKEGTCRDSKSREKAICLSKCHFLCNFGSSFLTKFGSYLFIAIGLDVQRRLEMP